MLDGLRVRGGGNSHRDFETISAMATSKPGEMAASVVATRKCAYYANIVRATVNTADCDAGYWVMEGRIALFGDSFRFQHARHLFSFIRFLLSVSIRGHPWFTDG